MLLRDFDRILSESVRCRVQGIRGSRVAILFSGGLDCTVLAALAARYVKEPMDLLNVSFENPRAIAAAYKSMTDPVDAHTFPIDPYAVPDRVTARDSCAQLAALFPACQFRLVEVNVPYAEYAAHLDIIQALMLSLIHI